ncbi:MAG: DNA-processing protein DprA, partial [Alphaproteobacteria bacterium]|nr:DNA-processing protein DprA [Alphaproteobacteria bacterium]
MSDADRLRLARAEGVGPITYRRLLARFGSPAAALEALPGLARAGGRAAPLAIPPAAAAGREIARTARLGATLLFVNEPGYPPLLGLLEDAPPVIAVLGDPEALAAPAVALVGSRNASANGRRFAEVLAQELGGTGRVVVSGM